MEKTATTQIRMPDHVMEYLKREAARIGCSQNGMILMLIELGRKVLEAQANITIQG